MSLRNYRVFRTNAGCRVGRPQKGFEAWRKSRLTAKPDTLQKYILDCCADIKKRGGRLSFWYVENGIPKPAVEVNKWNYIVVKFSNGDTRFRSFSSFKEDYEKYCDQFKNWQQAAFI